VQGGMPAALWLEQPGSLRDARGSYSAVRRGNGRYLGLHSFSGRTLPPFLIDGTVTVQIMTLRWLQWDSASGCGPYAWSSLQTDVLGDQNSTDWGRFSKM